MTLRVDRSAVSYSEAVALDDALDCAAQRRERNRAAGLCINENRSGTHGKATHGVCCRRCRATHRGVSVDEVAA